MHFNSYIDSALLLILYTPDLCFSLYSMLVSIYAIGQDFSEVQSGDLVY